MACNNQCSYPANDDVSIDTTTMKIYCHNNCSQSLLTNAGCTASTAVCGFAEDISFGTGCNGDPCTACGVGTFYFTTNGAGVVTCYSNAGCTTPCSGSPEPFVNSNPSSVRQSISSSILPIAIFGITFLLFIKNKNVKTQ